MSHVKGHNRTTPSGQTVFVKEHDDKRTARPQQPAQHRDIKAPDPHASLHGRTAFGRHRDGSHYIRAANADDAKAIAKVAKRQGVELQHRPGRAVHQGKEGMYHHFHHKDQNALLDVMDALHRHRIHDDSAKAFQSYDKAKEAYAANPETKGGKKIDVDEAREISTEYQGNRTIGAAVVHEDASGFAKRLFAERMAMPIESPDEIVTFMAGGGGSGKGSASKKFKMEDASHTIWDGAMSNAKKAESMIRMAVASGRRVEINYIHRPVEKAVHGMVGRAHGNGRVVPLDVLSDAHRGAQQAIQELAAKYKDNPRVHIRIVDNSGDSIDDVRIVPPEEWGNFFHETAYDDTIKSRVADAYRAKLKEGHHDRATGKHQDVAHHIRRALDPTYAKLGDMPRLDAGEPEGQGRAGAGDPEEEGSRGRVVQKAHVKGHIRHLADGSVIWVDTHERPGQVAKLHARTTLGKHKDGTFYLRATDGDDAATIRHTISRVSAFAPVSRKAKAIHHGKEGRYEHFHFSSLEEAARVHAALEHVEEAPEAVQGSLLEAMGDDSGQEPPHSEGGSLGNGPFPPSPDGEIQKGLASMDRVIAAKGKVNVRAAFHRPGLGSISIYWGSMGIEPGKPFAEATPKERAYAFKKGSGVAKIIAKREWEGHDGVQAARSMIHVIGRGEVGPVYGPEGGQRRDISFEGSQAVLSLFKNGTRETWLLTGFPDHAAPGEPEKVHHNFEPTPPEPTDIRPEGGAGANLNVIPSVESGKASEEAELKPGDTMEKDGKTYVLNQNHRWELSAKDKAVSHTNHIDKVEERRDRLDSAADKAREKSSSAFQRSAKISERFDMGQPIILDHHSTKSGFAAQARMDGLMRTSIEASKRASDLEEKAASVGKAGINSDDASAVDQLRAKLAKMERKQARMKAVNAAHGRFVKNPASLDKTDLTEDEKAMVRAYKPQYSWEPHPYPPFELSNNNANIIRVRKRIEDLERETHKRATMDEAEQEQTWALDGHEVTVTEDHDENRLVVDFGRRRIPTEQYELMQSRGFHHNHNRRGTIFTRKLNDSSRAWAELTLKAMGATRQEAQTEPDPDGGPGGGEAPGIESPLPSGIAPAEGSGVPEASERPPEPDGPKEGDHNEEGLVFREGRWHREESPEPPAPDQPITLEDHESFHARLQAGEVTPEEVREAWGRFKASQDPIKAELQKKKLEELYKLTSGGVSRWRGTKKEDVVKSVLSSLAMDYLPSFVFSHSPFEETREAAVERQILAITPEQIKAYADEVAKMRQARQERIAALTKAVTNPETLEDFQNFIRFKGEGKLTPEQRTRYDELMAQAGLAKRQAAAETKASVAPVDLGDVGMELKQTKHTKTGEDLHVVTLGQRVETEKYRELLAKAKRLGGWYSSFRGAGAIPGFQFKTEEAARTFMGLGQGQAADLTQQHEERAEEKKARTSNKLQTMADSMEEKANAVLNQDRKTNTSRRAAQAASTEAQAEKQIAMARTLRNLGDALEAGDLQLLGGITTRAQVEELDRQLRLGQNTYAHLKDAPGHRGWQAEYYREPEARDVDHVKFPYPSLDRGRIMSLVRNLQGVDGGSRLAARLAKIATFMKDDDQHLFQGEEIDLVKKAADKIRPKARYEADYLDTWSLDPMKRLAAAGITNEHELRAALREYLTYRTAKPKPDAVKEAERALAGAKIPGYFPTPASLASDMVQKADIKPGMKILEPSAGKGNLIDAIHAQHGKGTVEVDAIEPVDRLRTILEAKGHNLAGRDIMDHDGQYDRVIMNPPFENRQDVDHVRKAYDLLKPGGRLVAIVSEGPFFGSDKKAVEFRSWLDSHGAEAERNPEGSFKTAEAERHTGVATRTVVIDKPDEGESAA